MQIPGSEMLAIRVLYDAGQYIRAWQRANAVVPVAQLRDPAALTLAGRIAANLEGARLGKILHGRAWRAARGDPETAYYRASAIARRLGPLQALRFLDGLPGFPDATPVLRANFLSMRAVLLAQYRDFSPSFALLDEADALDPACAWTRVERAHVLEMADDYPGAVAAAEHALRLEPFYRPAVGVAGHLYCLVGRDADAIALLSEAADRLESPSVAAQLGALLFEQQRFSEALGAWNRYKELALLIEQPGIEWWHARMSDTLYELGSLAPAAEHATLAKNGFHKQIAARLAAPPADARVVKLPVPFVRQHDMTCAPATLSALSRHWRAPVDHLVLAREICYDGTQSHRERRWAEENGYVAREFTVTWDAARALLDRGIPFALATVETRSAHLQAIVGYDNVRGVLFVRDPFHKHHVEVICPGWLDDYAFSGPRGLALVPVKDAALLDGIALPDAGLYDSLHVVERSIYLHDRPAAAEAMAGLEAAAPGHRITFEARRALAWYDGNQPAALAAIGELLALFPESNNLRWARFNALRDLARGDEHRALLAEMARDKKSEPAFWREMGDDLRADARQRPVARRWLLRALRQQPCVAENLHSMAGLLWDERRFAEALELYRFAACLRDKVGYLQRSWFIAARYFHREAEVLAVFAARAERDGGQSPQPVFTLHWALAELGRTPEAFAALDAALARRPDDGELLTFAADQQARHGRAGPARALLARAEGKCARPDWLRSAAKLADYRGDLPDALRLWREVLADSPLSMDALGTAARLIAEVEGRTAALEFLRGRVAQHPHHIPLRELLVQWLRDEGPQAQEPELRAILAMAPENAWAERELALALSALHRFDEALAHCAASIAIEPQSDTSHCVHGSVLRAAGRVPEAGAAFREAVARNVDNSNAMEQLVAASPTFAEKREALRFILAELERQVVFGDGLFSYVQVAFPVLDPEELLQNLKDAHSARPDLWHAWSVLITHLCDAKRAAEARALALQATERFPLHPRLWLDLARVHCEQRDFAAEAESLRRAVDLSPAWGRASRELSDSLQRLGRYDEAQRVLEDAIAAAPLDAANRGCLADLLWRRSRDARALALLEEAIRLDPGYEWAWDTLRDWSPDGSRAAALARELTHSRAGEAASWQRLADMLPNGDIAERLAALDRALALDPRFEKAHDTRAWILATAGRYDEASAACAPAIYRGAVPRALRGRSAWVKAQRGNIVGALSEIREVVAEYPDFYWGWRMIADWSGELGEHQSARDAADKMARLAPRNAVPLGYLADAELKLGNRGAALAVLERAFALDPSYGFAATTLFDAHMEKGELDRAAEKLAQMRIHLPGPDTDAAALRLCVKRNNLEEACNLLEGLVRAPASATGALRSAVHAFTEHAWTEQAGSLLEAHIEDEGVNPAVGSLWVGCFVARRSGKMRRRVYRLDPRRPVTLAAWQAFIEACNTQATIGHISPLVRRHRAVLRAKAELWGTVGYALVKADRDREAARWLADWRTREGVRPWMLSNVVAALVSLGRFDAAIEASRHALTLAHDHTYPQHILWVALDEAARGDVARAGVRLSEMREQDLDDFEKAQWTVVDAARSVASLPPAERRAGYARQRARLDPPNQTVVARSPALRRYAARIITVMARAAGFRFPVARGLLFKLRFFQTTRLQHGALIVAVVTASALSRCGTQEPRDKEPAPPVPKEWKRTREIRVP